MTLFNANIEFRRLVASVAQTLAEKFVAVRVHVRPTSCHDPFLDFFSVNA